MSTRPQGGLSFYAAATPALDGLPIVQQEAVRALQELPQEEAIDMLYDIACGLGTWTPFLNLAGLYVCKPDNPTSEG